MEDVDPLRALRMVLARLYPTEEDARPVVRFAGLDARSIRFSTKAANNWYNILDEAEKQDRVLDIVRIALDEYPNNAELVQVSQAYTNAPVEPVLSSLSFTGRTGVGSDKRLTEGSEESEEASIKILFLAANPLDTTPLLLDHEMRAIDAALQKGDFRALLDVEQHWAVRFDELQEFLLRHQPTIVHFSGHGSSRGEIMLEGFDGGSHPVAPEILGDLFKILKDNMRCVVLNTCYSEPQAQAIAEHIDVVLGMSSAITDQAAMDFASGFYLGLSFGRSIQTSFELGCSRIDLANLAEQDRPRLVAQHCETSKIFLVPKSKWPSHNPDR